MANGDSRKHLFKSSLTARTQGSTSDEPSARARACDSSACNALLSDLSSPGADRTKVLGWQAVTQLSSVVQYC